MSRLIDADTLCEKIRKIYDGYMLDEGGCAPIDFENMVDDMPTAFDTEKVVEQLMVIHDEGYCPNEDGLECVLDKTCSDCYREKIIDIVKKGGGVNVN